MNNTTYDYDVFISYRFRNNRGMTEGEAGWITTFQTDLEVMLSQLLSRHPRVWRREESSTAPIVEQLREEVNRASVLIIVMFPDFIESEWCLQELRWFIKDNELRGGDRIGNKSRIFVIRATHFDRERMPPEVENLVGFDFFELDYKRERPLNFRRGVSTEVNRKYWEKIYDLAQEIRDMLEQLSQ